MGYKLKTHSSAKKRFKKTGSGLKRRSANRSHILTKQTTKRKRHNRGLIKMQDETKKIAKQQELQGRLEGISNQFKEIENFFQTMPKLSHTVKVYNPKTKVESDVLLEGLASFFG